MTALCLYAACVGAKFYLPLSVLLPAVASGLVYSPVSKADLARGYPAPGWNQAPEGLGTAAAAAAPRGMKKQPVPLAPATQPKAAAAAGWKPSSKGVNSTLPKGSQSHAGALQQLLATVDVKWRAVMPSGDRLGPFAGKELLGWLAAGGSAPKGVSKEDARSVAAGTGMLKLCGISAADYNQQKLPGREQHDRCNLGKASCKFSTVF
jgi:hypothetical protein